MGGAPLTPWTGENRATRPHAQSTMVAPGKDNRPPRGGSNRTPQNGGACGPPAPRGCYAPPGASARKRAPTPAPPSAVHQDEGRRVSARRLGHRGKGRPICLSGWGEAWCGQTAGLGGQPGSRRRRGRVVHAARPFVHAFKPVGAGLRTQRPRKGSFRRFLLARTTYRVRSKRAAGRMNARRDLQL